MRVLYSCCPLISKTWGVFPLSGFPFTPLAHRSPHPGQAAGPRPAEAEPGRAVSPERPLLALGQGRAPPLRAPGSGFLVLKNAELGVVLQPLLLRVAASLHRRVGGGGKEAS